MHILAVGDVPEPDPVPVSTQVVVDPSMALVPISPAILTSRATISVIFGIRRILGHTIDVEDSSSSHAQHDDQAIPSQSSYFSSSSPKLPISLPLNSPRWTEILASHLPCGPSTPDDLIRVVEEDSRTFGYSKTVESLREYNRQAIIAGLPLAPIPNVDGLKVPLGANNPITSISQIEALSPVELKAWLDHYGLPLPLQNNDQSNTRSTLAIHLGLSIVLPA